MIARHGNPVMTRWRPLLAALCMALALPPACAGERNASPEGGQRIDFEQKPGAVLPLRLAFYTARGVSVRLDELLRDKPTVLVAGYYHCASLCGAVRDGLAQALARTGLTPGRDINVVLFSIDPRDTVATALSAQRHDARRFPAAHIADWLYLTGSEAASATLAAALGFHYDFDPATGQFRHPAGIVLLTPQGHIAQYFFGVQFAPQSLRLALVAASRGEIGGTFDRLLLLCGDFDASTGRYSVLIERLLAGFSLGGALLLGAGIALLRRRETRVRP